MVSNRAAVMRVAGGIVLETQSGVGAELGGVKLVLWVNRNHWHGKEQPDLHSERWV